MQAGVFSRNVRALVILSVAVTSTLVDVPTLRADNCPLESFSFQLSFTAFPAQGGVGQITVNAPMNCQWVITTAFPWVSLSNASGVGTGTFGITVSPNTGPFRAAILLLNGIPLLAVPQLGGICQVSSNEVSAFAGTPFSRDGKPLSMDAIFAPKDGNGMPMALSDKAAACSFVGFNWQQQVVSLPSPSPFFPVSPGTMNPANLAANGSLKAPPSFLDPPQGDGYILEATNGQLVYDYDNAYPFFWNSNDLAGNMPCVPAIPIPVETTGQLRFQDCPGDFMLMSGAGIKFRTSLVGISICPPQATDCTPGLPAPSQPLWTFDWESTFTGSAMQPFSGVGGVSQLKSSFPIDPFTGTGGVSITSINGTAQAPAKVACAASPNVLWPPNGSPLAVTVSGIVTPGTQAILPTGTIYMVKDAYGQVQPSGTFGFDGGGNYSFPVSLISARNGDDIDGRTYTINVFVRDEIGNLGSCMAVVMVPHDLGK